jgi:polar amino acid transport system permease protein
MTVLNRRQLHDQRMRRRSLLISGASLLAVVVALVLLVPLAPGWAAVKSSFFNGEILFRTFPTLLLAFVVDLKIFLWSAPLIFALSLAIALARNTQRAALFPLRLFAAVYTDVLRGVPVILLVYLIGFGIPGLGLPRPYNSPYIWGTVALVLGYSAYVAEVFRAGIESVHASQTAAARSLGLSGSDTMRYVVLPQAIRRQVPALMNFVIALLKDVALLSVIGPIEVLRQANVYKSLLANFTPYVGAAIIFLCVTIPVTRYADYLLARQRRERSV